MCAWSTALPLNSDRRTHLPASQTPPQVDFEIRFDAVSGKRLARPRQGSGGSGQHARTGAPDTSPVSVSGSTDSSGHAAGQTPIWDAQGRPLTPKLAEWWAETQSAFAAGGHISRGEKTTADGTSLSSSALLGCGVS